ncbi:MAG: hypothetical protein Q8Q32_00315 [bacterium]|nr:hypothetical protein [bacterium]
MDNQISYRDMPVGTIIVLEAMDAVSEDQRKLALQLVGFHDVGGENNDPQAILAIYADGFHLHRPNGEVFPALSEGTLCLAGVSATLLPRVVFRMMGMGGPGLGRDYSLEYVGGENQDLVIHRISKMWVVDPSADFPPITDHSSFLEGVARVRLERTEREAERQRELDAMPELSKEEIRCLRGVLEMGPLPGLKSVERTYIKEMKEGQSIMVCTYSGNRYLLRVRLPHRRRVWMIMLRVPEGFSPDGFDASCRDVIVGERLDMGLVVTSRVTEIYLL